MKPVVSLEGVGKRYVKYDDVPLLLTRALRLRAGLRRTSLWALRDISLQVEHGGSLGVIGRNGSGKSTMFRMLAGVTAPTEGVVRVSGRVAPLIAVGVGFHPELTGRENVYVNGIILGLTKREIDRRLDSIIDFAEIEEFIDTPVKFYSSGMFVRLGFSVAVASHPEVLLVDEVLAVGDQAFQLRCFERMEEIRQQGATFLVVSHNLNAIRRLCSQTILLNNGESLFVGDTDEAISRYHDILGELALDGGGEETAEVRLRDFTLSGASGERTAHVQVGDELTFSFEAVFVQPADRPIFGVLIHNETGQLVYAESTATGRRMRVEAGETVRCRVALRASLPTASYTAVATVLTGIHDDAAKAKSGSVNFFVSGRPFVKGAADLGATFSLVVVQDPFAAAAGPEAEPGETPLSGTGH